MKRFSVHAKQKYAMLIFESLRKLHSDATRSDLERKVENSIPGGPETKCSQSPSAIKSHAKIWTPATHLSRLPLLAVFQ